jgi:hypothetical protein
MILRPDSVWSTDRRHRGAACLLDTKGHRSWRTRPTSVVEAIGTNRPQATAVADDVGSDAASLWNVDAQRVLPYLARLGRRDDVLAVGIADPTLRR